MQVLKPKYSLRGENSMPIAVRMKSEEAEPRNFAGLKEDIGDIILLAGVDRSIEGVRILRLAILYAYIVGAPRGSR